MFEFARKQDVGRDLIRREIITSKKDRHMMTFRFGIVGAVLISMLLVSSPPAMARGGRGGAGFVSVWHGHSFDHGRRHGNDEYAKAAVAEREKLLAKFKNICRGC
jgi:hypothetical protein